MDFVGGGAEGVDEKGAVLEFVREMAEVGFRICFFDAEIFIQYSEIATEKKEENLAKRTAQINVYIHICAAQQAMKIRFIKY